MALSKAKTKVQVSRLVSLPSKDKEQFSVEPQQIRNDLGQALERFCSSDEEAQAAVDWLIFSRDAEIRKWRPVPGEIADAVREVREQSDRGVQSPEGCEICNGYPWVTVERTAFDPLLSRMDTKQGSRRCNCSKGQYLRTKDAENAAKRAAGQLV